MGDLFIAPALVVGGAALALYSIFGKRRFYNDVEMPLTPEEEADKNTPPTVGERIGYGLLAVLVAGYGLWRLAAHR